MSFKEVFAIIFLLFFILATTIYFVPFNTISFLSASKNYNFSDNENSSIQFYSNLRFSDSDISYKINNCPLGKQGDMKYAFKIIENLTSLNFYPVTKNEQISVSCNEKDIIQNGLYIAGEGGPTNITVTGMFNLITHAEILLIKESNCPKPNIAIHELFHALGFMHSTNPDNVMFNVTDCNQQIGQDMIQEINRLYSYQDLPDLIIENASATMNGRFLTLKMTALNIGLGDAKDSKIKIYTGNTLLKEINLTSINAGYGRTITLENLFVAKLGFNRINLVISADFNELNNSNNNIILETKK